MIADLNVQRVVISLTGVITLDLLSAATFVMGNLVSAISNTFSVACDWIFETFRKLFDYFFRDVNVVSQALTSALGISVRCAKAAKKLVINGVVHYARMFKRTDGKEGYVIRVENTET